jgi:predicted Zn-dependent protease
MNAALKPVRCPGNDHPAIAVAAQHNVFKLLQFDQDLYALAQTFYRVGTSSTNLTDGDVIANIDKLPILYCNPDATKIPMTQVDFEYVMLHEIGHVWGLGHDRVNTDAVVAPPKYWGPQSAKRTLTTNDSGRLKFQYGP